MSLTDVKSYVREQSRKLEENDIELDDTLSLEVIHFELGIKNYFTSF